MLSKKFNNKVFRFFVTALSASLIMLSTSALPAEAVTGSEFNPGNIISDSVFFNGSTYSVQETQSFLNSKVPTCLLGVNGRKVPGTADPAYPSGRVIYANNCLKDYRESIPNINGDNFCASVSGGNYSSSELIVKVSTACNVSPKVLIVLLEKEQSLVTDAYPSTVQYSSATGFNCPDTAPCSSASSGFFKQIYSAARQFQSYGTGIFTWYPVGTTTQVRFNPNSGCGSSSVFIQNRATAALYYYTPYQPNSAALNNLYGTGDGCSAYGNRNFWRMYNDWFGTTQEIPGSREFVSALYADVLGRNPGSSESDYWVARLSAGTSSRYDLASFFTNSDEFRNIKIVEAYRLAFDRAPDAEGSNYWLNEMRNGRIRPDDLFKIFLATPELFYQQGGGTASGYVSKLYEKVFGRLPDQAGLTFWTLQYGQIQNPIFTVRDYLWYSAERTSINVQAEFQRYLGRAANPSEIAFWSGFTLQNTTSGLRAALLFTQEYKQRAEDRF